MQPRETVVVDAADFVVPQHPGRERNETLQPGNLISESHAGAYASIFASRTACVVLQAHGTCRSGPSRSDWLLGGAR